MQTRKIISMLGLIAALIAVAGCGKDQPTELNVIAATSLKQPFTSIAKQYEAKHPGVKVRTSFAPSDKIAIQVRAGYDAAVVATANREHMTELESAGKVASPQVFAGNRLVIAVSNNSRAKIRSPRDLSGDIRLSVGAASVPVGSYAEHAIEQMNARFGGGFGAAVHKNIANRGQSAADVITPVALGGLDASISYASDVKAESGRVTAMAIPKWAQPQISYWIAPAQKAGDEAGGFIDYVESPAGQEALRSAGFSPVPESGTK